MRVLLGHFAEVVHNVAYSDEFVYCIVADFDVEFLFAQQHQVSQLQRIDSQIVDKLRGRRDILGIDGQFFHQQVFNLIEHMLLLLDMVQYRLYAIPYCILYRRNMVLSSVFWKKNFICSYFSIEIRAEIQYNEDSAQNAKKLCSKGDFSSENKCNFLQLRRIHQS